MKSSYEIKWDDDSTGAPVCVHCTRYMHLCMWEKYIREFNARNVIWSCDLFLALCLQVYWIWLPCKCLFAYKITNERITLALAFRVSQTWAGTIFIRDVSVSHEETFFTVWIEDCQNHRRMKRSLSTSPPLHLHSFSLSLAPHPLLPRFLLVNYSILTSLAHTKHILNFPHTRAKTFLSLSSHTIHMHVN